jgi:hypothetical protein
MKSRAVSTLKEASLFIVIIAVLIPLLYVPAYTLYTMIDQTTFPKVSSEIRNLKPDMKENRKGAALAQAMILQLEREMRSGPWGIFGWSVNDLLISPTRWLDNRANRQRGVIFATRMLTQFFSTNLAKYGRVDEENENLKEARTKCFAYTETKWWFASTESRYREGIKLVNEYRENLLENKAVYNMRTDDQYNLLTFIIGPQFIDQPLGRLIQSNDEVDFTDLDDRIYYAQGVILVVRDFITAFTEMYPDIVEKGGKENMRIAMKDMDRICTFDPLIVLRGDHDSLFADHRGKLARYLISLRERLNDVAQSIRR